MDQENLHGVFGDQVQKLFNTGIQSCVPCEIVTFNLVLITLRKFPNFNYTLTLIMDV